LLPYPQYVEIKDKYCLAYSGNCNEYIVQLLYLLNAIEKELPGIKIYVACKKELLYLAGKFNTDRLVSLDLINDFGKIFAYTRILNCDLKSHPILQLLEESNLTLSFLESVVPISETRKCVISPKGLLPTKSLEYNVINQLKEMASSEGYDVEIGDDISGAGWVIGVENMALFLAAINGIRTTLVPTGVGTEFYKKLFPKNEVLMHI
jgi:hypothetical protein